ncbi:MAG: hypothetical protein L0Y75_09895 [Acidobacteria bacterium]|nr:hypothetical protein [Acidobacteriota bacterium]
MAVEAIFLSDIFLLVNPKQENVGQENVLTKGRVTFEAVHQSFFLA